MKKEIYLIRGLEGENYSEFSSRIVETALQASTIKTVTSVKVTYTAEKPPLISLIPFKKKKIAAISLFIESNERPKHLDETQGLVGAYEVEEAIPVRYKKSWPDLTPTMGVCLFTIFKQRPDIDYKTFLDRWHNSHTPLSLKIHPLWNYNRNVAQKDEGNTEHWDGIVEEQFKTKAELLNPVKFFGNPLIMPYRMWQVYSDTKSFLEYKTIEPYFATELVVKSAV